MLKIHLKTGTAWTKVIEVDGGPQDDLIQLIDDYYEEKGYLPVTMYTLEDLMQIYDEDELETELEQMIPINGGEFWIDGIEYVEE